MSILPQILAEVAIGEDEIFMMKELRKAHKTLEAKGFGRMSYNKNKMGEWTDSQYKHSDYPHEVTLSKAHHPKTGKPFLNIKYTKMDHKHLGSHDELVSHLNDDKTFPKSHWWSK